VAKVLPKLRLLHAGDGLATAELGSYCLILWREPVNHARFLVQREALELVTSRHADGIGILCVIEPVTESPSEELRTEASRLLAALSSRIRNMAYVVEGDGFRAAIIRGVLSSIELLRGKRAFPSRYFAETSAASRWLCAGAAQLHDELVSGVSELREQLDRVDGQAPGR
jgi:hypothetical protein